jgi:hypothetical protein
MILDDEWLLRDLVGSDEKLKWHVWGVNEMSLRVLTSTLDWNWGLRLASSAGNLILASYTVKRGANVLELALMHACASGQNQMVNFLINLGADSWDLGLSCACTRGDRDLVDLMINKGATTCYSSHCPGHEFKGGAHGRDTN